jgi:AraC-like DNA-binding protein
MGRNAPSVREACRRFVRYGSLLSEVHVFALEEHDSSAALVQRSPAAPSVGGRHPNEMFAAIIVRLVCELIEAPEAIRLVAFAHPAPPDVSEQDAFFRCAVLFGRGENRIEFDRSLLDRPIKGADDALLAVLDEQAERIVAERVAVSDAVSRVRQQIRTAVKNGQPTLELVATAMRVSPRTLQRRLTAEKTTFNALVDHVREELARAYIVNPRLALGEVAYLLGFSEISAFSRAFKRWTGSTPAAFRARG